MSDHCRWNGWGEPRVVARQHREEWRMAREFHHAHIPWRVCFRRHGGRGLCWRCLWRWSTGQMRRDKARFIREAIRIAAVLEPVARNADGTWRRTDPEESA